MSTSQAWFVEQRARSLAIVALTRHPRLQVSEAPVDVGVDLFVQVGGRPGRLFGVELKAATKIGSLLDATRTHLKRAVEEELRRLVESTPFPVAVLAIDVATEEVLFGWIKSPSELLSRKVKDRPVLRSATLAQIESAVVDVDTWYDKTSRLT